MTESSATATTKDNFENSWRYKIGLALIVGGHVILLGAIVLPAVGLLSAAMAATGVVVGEGVALISIAFLGKDGFLAIKNKIFGAVKAGLQKPVGRVRHTVGIVLLLTNFFVAATLALFAWFSYDAPPGGTVWGLSAEEQPNFYATLFLIGEFSFPIAIIILGGDWWQRFRELFIWHPPADPAA